MDVVRQFNENTYAEAGRVWPIDQYEIPRELLARCRRHRILKVPLLGQYFVPRKGDEQDWCGRTSSSMLYNYVQLAQGGNPRSRYISHWDAGKYTFLDLRFPSGERAFHQHPTSPPFDRKLSGVRVNSAITELWPHYREGTLLPYAATQARLDEAATIARSEPRLLTHFAPVIAAIDANNPLLIYTGFSRNRSSPGHLILIVGYAVLEHAGTEQLWLAMADPSTTTSKIVGAERGGVQFFRTPGPPTAFGNDLGALDQLTDAHTLIRLRHGDWYGRQGSMVLVRARAFFEQNTSNDATYDLLMDDFLNDGRKGGTFLYSTVPIEVPEALVECSDRRTVSFPFDDPSRADGVRGPVAYLHDNEIGRGGFYPLGLFRNVHSGIHLEAPTAEPTPVRAMAAGQIVAVRLPGGVQPEMAEPQGDPQRAARARELSGASNALVLVRHQLELRPPPAEKTDDGGAAAEAEPETLTFYSLYMHLLEPRWASPGERWADVPWLNALLRRRGGSLTLVDPDRPDLGTAQWPTSPPGEPLVEQGTFEVHGARFTEHEPLDLGAEGGRVRAVAKAAAEDIQQTLQALANGNVVTFAPACPDMAVERGQLLGFVSPDSALGRGFLHWEVLAPEGGGLSSLVSFAQQRLGAATVGSFPEFREQSEDNLFDPQGQELDDLVELLPDGAGQPVIANDYGPAELRALLRDARHLPFALEAEPQPDHALVYPATLRVHSFRDAMPPGDYVVKLRFVGGERSHVQDTTVRMGAEGPGEVTVMVPAWAEAVEVTSDDVHVQQGGPPATLAEHAEHLARLAGARFRNVKLTHLNEWSAQGLETSLRARFEDAGDAVDPLVDAMAWWGHDEVPVVGPEGREPALFADRGEPWQLPVAGKLEHLHPVVAAWLVELLGHHGHVRPVEPRAAPGPEPAVGWLGWLPAQATRPPLRVGAPVQALAVSEASPAELSRGEVSIEVVVDDGATLRLGLGAAPWSGDVVRAGGMAWWWGTARLSVAGASPQALGEPVLTVGTPVIDASAPLPPPRASDRRHPQRLAWSLPFSEQCPHALMGWVVFRTWIGAPGEAPPDDPAAFTEARVGLPIHATRREAEAAGTGPVVEGGYVVRGPQRTGSYVTANFTWSEYLGAAGGTADRVAWSLIEGVQAVRTAYGSSITLSTLASDGLSIRLKGASTERVLERAEAHPGFARASIVDEGPWIEVAVEAPPQSQETSGVLDLGFDPTAAYAALLEELNPSPERHVHVRLGVRVHRGGPLIDPALADVDAFGVGVVTAIDWDARAAEAGAVLEAFATETSAVLSRPAFGAPSLSISGRSLVVSVPLVGGDRAMWAACAPKISVEGQSIGKVLTRAGAGPHEAGVHLVASLDMAHARYHAKALSMTATVTKTGVHYGETLVAIADSAPIEYDTRARIEAVTLTPTPADDPERLEVRAQAYGVPSTNSLELYFEAEGVAPEAWASVPVAYARPDRWGSGRITGLCDPQGVFSASVSLDALHAVLQPEGAPRAFTAHVARRWSPALRQTVHDASASSQLAPPPAEDGTHEEQPVSGGMHVPAEHD